MAAARNSLKEVWSRPLPARLALIDAGILRQDIGYYLKNTLSPRQLVLIDVAQTRDSAFLGGGR